jgi:nucleoid-associated protein YgaU
MAPAKAAMANGGAKPKGGDGGWWYVVKEDDNLTTLAKRFYGNPKHFRRILTANRNRIDDQDLIYEGMRLRIPSA